MTTKQRDMLMAVVRYPLLWGSLAAVLFYVGLDASGFNEPTVMRYLAGHWASYVCVTMFLVGVAATVIKTIDLVGEYAASRVVFFEGLPTSDMPVSDAGQLTQRLDAQPPRIQRSYLVTRLRAALEYLGRKGSTENLEDELRSLAELDADRKHSSYGIMRMMLWAMPFIGSLGTVIGIGQAVANLGPEVSIDSITAGLGLVFDTTALALLLSVFLMLAMFAADHIECRFLAAVDARTNRELVGRFRGQSLVAGLPGGGGGAGPAGSVSNDAMVEVMEKMAERQSEMWQASLTAATKHWEEQNELLKKQIETTGSAPAGSAAMIAAGGGGLDAAALKEILSHNAGMSGMHQHEMAGLQELIRELSEVIQQDSRNWPVRLAMRRKVKATAAAPAANADGDWMAQS